MSFNNLHSWEDLVCIQSKESTNTHIQYPELNRGRSNFQSGFCWSSTTIDCYHRTPVHHKIEGVKKIRSVENGVTHQNQSNIQYITRAACLQCKGIVTDKLMSTRWASGKFFMACRKGLKVHTAVPWNCVQYYLVAADVPFSPWHPSIAAIQLRCGNIGHSLAGCDWRSWYIVLACTKIGPRYGNWSKKSSMQLVAWWGGNNNIYMNDDVFWSHLQSVCETNFATGS